MGRTQPTGSVRTASRHYLAAEHLWSALHHAQLAADYEVQHAREVGIHTRHRAYVISTVFSAVAFLEALVNELFEDVVDGLKSGRLATRIEHLDGRSLVSMAEVWAAERQLDVLRKYQMALVLADRDRFDLGAAPAQDIPLVVALRNNLVHFKPQWHEHQGIDQWERKLQGRVAASPFLAESSNPWFPGKCLSASCAKWACDVVREFADIWSDRLDLKRTYASVIDEHSHKD